MRVPSSPLPSPPLPSPLLPLSLILIVHPRRPRHCNRSNAPYVTDGLCTGVFWLRNTPQACGILRNWWDADWPNLNFAHPFEQDAMSRAVHRCERCRRVEPSPRPRCPSPVA